MMLSDPLASASGMASEDALRSARVATAAFFHTRETSGLETTPRREKTAPPQKTKHLPTSPLRVRIWTTRAAVRELGLDERLLRVPAEDGRQAQQHEFKRQASSISTFSN